MSVYFFLRLRERVTVVNFLGFAVACTLAALVKATTFFAFALLISLWVAAQVLSSFRIRWFHVAAFFGLVIAVGFELWWSRFSEALRLQGTLTDLWLHKNVMTFVTGENALKWEAETWARFVERGRLSVGHKLFFVPLLVLPWMKARLRWLSVAGLFFIFVPFLAFTNVHVKHDYYAFAHGFGFIMVYCALLLHLLESQSPRLRTFGSGLTIASFALQFSSYITKDSVHYREGIIHHQTEIDYIKNHSEKSDVILISGVSWDPTIPFLAERRATMFQFPLAEMAGQVKSMLHQLKEQGYKTPLWLFCDIEKAEAQSDLVKELLGKEPEVAFETKDCQVLRL